MAFVSLFGHFLVLRCSEFLTPRIVPCTRAQADPNEASAPNFTHIAATGVVMDASSAATSAVNRPGRGRVFDSIVDAIADTPIVRLCKMPEQHGVNPTIRAKLEDFNPAGNEKGANGTDT